MLKSRFFSQDALVVCRLRKNADFRASSSQKQREDGLVQDDDYVGQTGASEKDNKSYLVYEPELQISNGDITESSNVVEVSLLSRYVFFFYYLDVLDRTRNSPGLKKRRSIL